jgi:hypothetical protein
MRKLESYIFVAFAVSGKTVVTRSRSRALSEIAGPESRFRLLKSLWKKRLREVRKGWMRQGSFQRCVVQAVRGSEQRACIQSLMHVSDFVGKVVVVIEDQ